MTRLPISDNSSSGRNLPDQYITGRGGKGGRAEPDFYEAPNTITSSGKAQLLYLVSAGPIEGLVSSDASIYLSDVPLKEGEVRHFPSASWSMTTGMPAQLPASLPGLNTLSVEVPKAEPVISKRPIRIQRKDADAVRLTFRLPSGLVRRLDRAIIPHEVGFAVTWRAASSGSWTEIFRHTITEKQTTAFETQFLIGLPDKGLDRRTHQLRISRTTPLSDDVNIKDELVLSSVTWLIWDKLSYPEMACFALQVDTDVLDGRLPELALDIRGRQVKIPDNYTPESREYDGIWSGSFKRGWTDNPAWVLYDLLTDSRWGAGYDDSLIDRFDLYQIARYCDQMIAREDGTSAPRFTFNAVLRHKRNAARMIADICASIQCLYFFSGSRLRFVQDRPDTPIRHFVNNANVVDGRFVYHSGGLHKLFSHAMVSYDDSLAGISVQTAIAPDILAQNGYQPVEVFALGCTSAEQAMRHARWLLASQQSSSLVVSYRAGLDHFADNPVRPGDVIMITDQHQTADNGIAIRLEMTGYDNLLEPVSVQLPHLSTFIIRHRPASIYMQISFPVPDSDGGQVMHSVTAVYLEAYSDPDSGLYVMVTDFAPLSPYLPADGQPAVLTATQLVPDFYRWRVTAVKQVAIDKVEVVAIRLDQDKQRLIDRPAAPPEVNIPFLPATTGVTTYATGITIVQFERNQPAGLSHEIELSWKAAADTAPARLWQIVASEPDSSIKHQFETADPHLILPANISGTWQIAITARSWSDLSGRTVTASFTVNDELATLVAPTGLSATASAGKVKLVWNPASVSPVTHYEIWGGISGQPQTLLATTMLGFIELTTLQADTLYSFSVRYLRPSGAVSAYSDTVTSLTIGLPQPEDGAAGTQFLSIAISSAQFSATQADTAIRQAVSRAPVAGDMVTQYNAAQNFTYTARHDGSVWQAAEPHLNGNMLIDGTVAAKQIQLDGVTLQATSSGAVGVASISANAISSGILKSPNFSSGSSGFQIDLGGQAEFNDVILRGELHSGRVESSLLVSPIITLPTEAGGRFLTTHTQRRIIASSNSLSGNILKMGPLVIDEDDYSSLLGDRYQNIYAAHDKIGDNADTTRNTVYNRFRRLAPLMTVDAQYVVPDYYNPWGTHLRSVEISFGLVTGAGTVIARSFSVHSPLLQFYSAYQDLSEQRTIARDPNFEGTITLLQNRVYQPRSGHGSSQGYTKQFDMSITAQPIFSTTQSLTGQTLYIELTMTLNLIGTFLLSPTESFKNSAVARINSLS